MKALSHVATVRQLQGFDVYHLGNDEVELAVVPELGARLISLRDVRTGREWMWHPEGGLKLFRNQPGDDFFRGPLAGMDECLPTIEPCTWQGRLLPDHGEVWHAAWQPDAAAWENGILKTRVRLGISPFEFERTIELRENELRLSYHLHNRSHREERFIWAMHPLLRLQAGDQLAMPSATRVLFDGATWLDDVAAGIPENRQSKIFASPVDDGLAAIINPGTGDSLEFAWSSVENDTLGLWLTRGGWHGHHHFALEPANADSDTLALAAQRNRCGTVAANDSVAWQVRLRVGS